MKHGCSLVISLVLTAAMPVAADPLGTTITYQGVLTDAGSPVDGVVDLRFRLFDTATGGTELAVVGVDDRTVVDGRLVASLDFGDVFASQALWLQIEVRDGASTGAFDVLSSRQPLRPHPVGLFAVSADHAVTAGHADLAADASTVDGLSAADLLAFANRVGIPPGLGDGDHDTAAALVCAAGEMPGFDGSSWGCVADSPSGLSRTVVVGPVGDAAANGGALLAAVGALPVPASSDEGWILELEPGRYDLGSASLDLPPWTTLSGSGEAFTVITSAVCSSASGITATVNGQAHVEVRQLTVENTCSSTSLRSRAVSFDWSHDGARLTSVTARTSGGAGGCAGVINRSTDSVLDRVTAEVTGCAGQADAINTAGANALLTDCLAVADGSSANHGLLIGNRSFVNRGGFSATDTPGKDDAAVQVDADADLLWVSASSTDAAVRVISSHGYTVVLTGLTADGAVVAEDHGGSLLLVVEHSRVVAAGPTVVGDTGMSVGIAMTQLAGGAVSPSGGAFACAGVWDELWVPYAATCP